VNVRSVLVTGCSSGIGAATVTHLRDLGWRVLATARSADDLAALEADGFETLALDLADETSVAQCAELALTRCADGLGGLVNNAGYAQPGAVEDIDRDRLRRQLEVNVVGLQDLTNRVIPTMRRQGWGRIVNVSSLYGRIVAPLVGAYCASKYALEALSDAMRMELWSSGVGVSLIEPGAIVTDFRKNAAVAAEASLDADGSVFGDAYDRKIVRKKHKVETTDFMRRSPEEVAAKIHHALSSPRPRRRYGVTPAAGLVAVLRRIAPDALLDAIGRRSLK
jgi:NAD(P)-dependent dehydrogenase (short-subunit alcohol dehydrogenase family)